jgi:hypothetical protein
MSEAVRELLKQLGAREGLRGAGALMRGEALPVRDGYGEKGAGESAVPGAADRSLFSPSPPPHCCLPGLRAGEVHEWFGLDEVAGTSGMARKEWSVPLTLLTLLAGVAARSRRGGRVVFIGRRCWPTFQVVCAALAGEENSPRASRWGGVGAGTDTLQRCLFLEPLSVAERFWSIGESLRCVGVAAVVADASGMQETVSRRLQLAAEAGRRAGNGAGGVVGLLARPWQELEKPSWAATRWSVRAALSPDVQTRRWEVELVNKGGGRRGGGVGQVMNNERRKGWGGELAQDARPQWILDWTYQVLRGTGTLHVSPGLGRRAGAASGSPPPSPPLPSPSPPPSPPPLVACSPGSPAIRGQDGVRRIRSA